MLDDITMARRVAASINGTNNHKNRLKASTPEKFYSLWRESQIKRGEYEKVEYADNHLDDCMSEICTLFTREPKQTKRVKHTGLASDKDYRRLHALLEKYPNDKAFNDFANNIVFPRTTRFEKWKAKSRTS